MKLVHFSDTHLGFRAYQRTTARGINQREVDVAQSFTRAIDATIGLRPELVVIGGDIFHAVRPGNTAIVHAYNQFARLRVGLPGAEIVMVAGNHDSPRTAEAGSILRLFLGLGLHVVDGAAQTLDFPALDLSVLAVADNQHTRPELVPRGDRRFNVLLLHGEAGGISPKGSPAAERELSDDQLHADAWDYIAMGHYHVHRQVAANGWYSGALDYTSSNIWGERVEERGRDLEGKGIVERNLETGAQTFHPIQPSREIVDLTPFSVLDFTGQEASDAICDAVEAIPDGIDGKIVRLKVLDMPSHLYRAIDHKQMREYKRRALNFQLDHAVPEKRLSPVYEAVRRRAPISELVAEMLRARPLPSNVDRDELVALGAEFLEAAGDDRAVQRSEETREPVPVAA